MKNGKSMLILVVIMSTLSFVCLTLGFAYSYVIQSFTGNTVSINAGNLSASINYSKYTDYFTPISDAVGISSNAHSTMKLQNNGDYNMYYTLGLKYDTDDADIINNYGLIPLENIRFALFNENNTQLTTARTLADCAISYHDPNNYLNDVYLIYEDSLQKNSQKQYGIKVWLDENTSSDFDDTYLGLKLAVDQEPIKSKLRFSVSGTLKINNAPIVGSITNLITGKTITSDLDGTTGKFLLSDLFSDTTYPILIEYNNQKYKTSLHFEHGDSRSIQSIVPGSGQSNTYIQASAYTYHTTVKQIMDANSSITTSNLPINGTYNIPNSYVFKSNISDIFSDVNVNITSNQVEIS